MALVPPPPIELGSFTNSFAGAQNASQPFVKAAKEDVNAKWKMQKEAEAKAAQAVQAKKFEDLLATGEQGVNQYVMEAKQLHGVDLTGIAQSYLSVLKSPGQEKKGKDILASFYAQADKMVEGVNKRDENTAKGLEAKKWSPTTQQEAYDFEEQKQILEEKYRKPDRASDASVKQLDAIRKADAEIAMLTQELIDKRKTRVGEYYEGNSYAKQIPNAWGPDRFLPKEQEADPLGKPVRTEAVIRRDLIKAFALAKKTPPKEIINGEVPRQGDGGGSSRSYALSATKLTPEQIARMKAVPKGYPRYAEVQERLRELGEVP